VIDLYGNVIAPEEAAAMITRSEEVAAAERAAHEISDAGERRDLRRRSRVERERMRMLRHELCPVAVRLIGLGLSGKPGSLSGVWPLMFPLAPHQEAAMRYFEGPAGGS
jgi:hypothetical protein